MLTENLPYLINTRFHFSLNQYTKGKADKRYEFGYKVSMVTTSKNNWVVGIQVVHGNLFDGHTLKSSIEQSEKITNWKAKNINVDLGYGRHHNN